MHVDDPLAKAHLTQALDQQLRLIGKTNALLTVVCIGSDRSTGDALGPLVGSRLERLNHPRIQVKGTLQKPVHAANLADHLSALRREPSGRAIIAVDACLGRSENVGTVCVKPGPLRPGTGVNKTLPTIGEFHIIGVVNVGGFMEYFVLQNTRLSLVMQLADLIAEAIADSAIGRTEPKSQSAPQVAVSKEV